MMTDFHEVWWIYADNKEWGGMRIAHFRKMDDGSLIFVIPGDSQDRLGPRVWDDVSIREGWRKIEQIPIPKRPALV